MYNLQQNAKASIRKLQEEVQNEADGLHYKVINLLSSQDFLPKITQWEPSQCPQADKKWKKVSGSASEVIAQRLTQEINNWERRNGIKASIKDKIIGRFKRDFELMEDQINDIEGICSLKQSFVEFISFILLNTKYFFCCLNLFLANMKFIIDSVGLCSFLFSQVINMTHIFF